MVAGFSESVLLDGAGLEQIGSALPRLQCPERDSKIKGLRAWDNARDRAGIQISIKLFQMNPNMATTQNVMPLVTKSTAINKRPYTA